MDLRREKAANSDTRWVDREVERKLSRSEPAPTGQRARIDALYADICGGDKGAVAKLITECMPAVEKAVNIFVRKRPHFSRLRDDLIGEAYLRLVKIVTDFSNGQTEAHTNVRAYILRGVDRALEKFCNEEPIVGGCNATVRANVSTGNYEPVRLESSDSIPLPDRHQEADALADETLSEIRACCRDDLDHDIVTLRFRGLKDREVAEQLDVSRETVKVRRLAIEKRFNARRQREAG